jgi:predicted patatin/cPLA2 family phospholipase
MEELARHAHEKLAKDPAGAVDVLIISGGGDWGAFGTGFLLGWGEAPAAADRRPSFDVVSGVSTGALIAPFAYMGTKEDLETVDNLYRNPKADWVRQRGLLYFLPDNASFAEVPGLEREVDSFITMDFARRVAAETSRGRMLFINTTNLDDGSQLPFRWGVAAQRAVKDGDIRRLQNILLASSGIPGAFPPRQVDEWLLVDGAVTSNIIYGGALKREDSFGAAYKALYPGSAVPKLRYWVILNNYAVAQPRTVQPTWPAVIERSLEVAVRASTTVALRHLYAMAELNRLRGDGDAEVRWVAIPNSWKQPVDGIFKAETMRSLSDLGRSMGRDAASWKSESP